MTDPAAIAGSYSDLKLVKSRSVCQVVVEIPIEQAERFIAAFGMPIPGAEKPVALALLKAEPKPEEKAKQSWASMSYAQRSGILRNDKRFLRWLSTDSAEGAAEWIRRKCGVESCSKIDGNADAMRRFDEMDDRYRQATGQMAARNE